MPAAEANSGDEGAATHWAITGRRRPGEDEGNMNITPLDEILNSSDPGDEDQVSEAPEATETPEQQAARERDEMGRFKAKDTGEDIPTADDGTGAATPAAEPERVPVAALMDERQKRQNLEERLRQYDEYFAQLNTQPQEVPDPFTDPDAHQAYVIEQAVTKAIERITPQLQRTQTLSRAEVSEMLARQKFEDYDQKIEAFKEAIQDNPFLIQQVQQAADPATFAYNAANKYLEAKQYGIASPTREQIEAEIREKVIAELGIRPKVPSTLAGDRSVGSRSGPAWTGPTPIEDILNS